MVLKKYLFVLIFFNSLLYAKDAEKYSIELQENFQEKNLLGSIVYLEDKNKIFSIEEISDSIANDFSRWNTTGEKELSFGFTASAYWVYFKIKNHSKSLQKVYLETNLATLDKVEFFYQDANKKFNKKTAGDMYPFKNREVKFRTIVFSIPIMPDTEMPIFLRLENKGPMKFSLQLRSPEEFSAHIVSDQVFLGIYYGIMIVIFLYNLFLYFSIRDTTYIYYINYVFHVAIYQFIISGNAAQFLFPDSPDFANRAPNVVANLTFITALLFTKSFLNTAFYAKIMNKIIISLVCVTIAQLSIILIVGHEMVLMKTSNILGLLMIVTIISSAVQVFRRGYRSARFFLFGWSFLLISVFIQIMANLGAFNITAEHIGQVGSGVEVILLSFALADRMKNQQIDSLSPQKTVEINSNDMSEEQEKKTSPKEFIRRPIFTILQKEYNLTYQQAQVCSALIDGKSRTIIADELGISVNTLKKHLSEIYSKTINKVENTEVPSQEKLQKLTIFLHNLKIKD